jgi:hypothetical protein
LITAIVAVVVLVLGVLDDELLELPHAASARLTAHVAASAPTRIESALYLLNRLVIKLPPEGPLSSLSMLIIINLSLG